MACNNYLNGSTRVDFVTPFPNGTADSTAYLLQLTHYTCGNKQMCLNNENGLPVVSNLQIQQVGVVNPLGDGTYCCDVTCICDLTYQQICGSGCCPNYCLQTEKCIVSACIPVVSDNITSVVGNGASVYPQRISCRCNTTNTVAIDVSITVNTGTTAETTDSGQGE